MQQPKLPCDQTVPATFCKRSATSLRGLGFIICFTLFRRLNNSPISDQRVYLMDQIGFLPPRPAQNAVIAQSPNATCCSVGRSNMTHEVTQWATQLSKSGKMFQQKHANFVLITKNKFLLKISQNNLGNKAMIWATHFSTTGGPAGDP